MIYNNKINFNNNNKNRMLQFKFTARVAGNIVA